jgi:polysaccharide export outer membrane protein
MAASFLTKHSGLSVKAATRRFSFALFMSGIAAAMLVSGCSGMRFSDSNAQYVKETESKPVRPIIRKITPQLIRQEMQSQVAGEPIDLSALMTAPKPYAIGPGDHLAITVWDHPELVMPITTMTGTTITTLAGATPTGYTVGADGKIQFPYAGGVPVAGRTVMQARDLLARSRSPYIKKPEITESTSRGPR